MKKMMYTGLALIVSCVMLTAWTSQDRNQPTSQATNQAIEENVIYITAEGYSEPDLWVGKTIPVTFKNVDNYIHTVTDDYGDFDSGIIRPGETFTISFPHAGVWTYHDQYSKATGMISVMGRDE
jgi:plastocyanin